MKSLCDLLESTKLSRLPELPNRLKSQMPDTAPKRAAAVVCAGCGGRIDRDDNFQQSVGVCRKCLTHYAKVDAAIDEASKRKRREMLERMTAAGGAK